MSRTPMPNLLFAAALAAAGLAACNPAPASSGAEALSDGADNAQSQTVADPATPAAPTTPSIDPTVGVASADNSTVAFSDDSLSFAAALPTAPANDPVVADLRREAESYLASVKRNARADFDRLKRSGDQPNPWEVRVRWKYTAQAGDIVSLAGEASEYNGGAHPMQRFDTHIARTDGEELSIDSMLLPKRSPSPAMTIAICEALKAAKQETIKSATIFDEPIVCAGPEANAKTEAAKLALAPSDQPDKFGGVYVFYEPYVVGAYAEGPYILTVQQGVFAEDLKEDFKALFAGDAPAWNN